MSEENIIDQLVEDGGDTLEASTNTVEKKQRKQRKSNTDDVTKTLEDQSIGDVSATVTLGVFALTPSAVIPEFATMSSACFDLSACFEIGEKIKCISQAQTESMRRVTDKGIAIHPNERFLIPTGLIFDIPEGYCLEVHPRSGLSFKCGLTLSNCTGIIDSDYVEQLYISVNNISGTAQYIQKGERIAQAKLIKLIDTAIVPLTERPLQKTDRKGGFGSTGK